MKLQQIINQRESDFNKLCGTYSVKSIYGFGSSVTNSFDEKNSDIDLLVEVDEIDPIKRGDKLLSLWDNLEFFFKRKVDLLTDSSIKNPYLRKSIDATKILVYGR